MTDYIKPAPMAVPDSEETAVEAASTTISGKKKQPFGKLLVWVTVIAFLMVLGWGLVRATAERPDGTAPNFEMQFFDGYEWQNRPEASLSDFEGKSSTSGPPGVSNVTWKQICWKKPGRLMPIKMSFFWALPI
jgi:hypothetical protein